MPAERDPALASGATQASTQQPPEAAQNGAAAALTITLAYETGWHEVYLHHCVEGKGVRCAISVEPVWWLSECVYMFLAGSPLSK